MTTLRKSGRRNALIVDINMVPFIDVVLVLLIIFMVMTPFLVQQQIKVSLPHAVTGQQAPDKPLIILLKSDGGMHLEGRSTAVNLLESELRAAVSRNPDQAVVIQADRDIALQRVVSVMDIAKRAQVSKLGISVEQPK